MGVSVAVILVLWPFDVVKTLFMKHGFSIFLLGLVVGCSSWPKVNVLGDEYYLSPFPVNEEISLPVDEGRGKAKPESVQPQ